MATILITGGHAGIGLACSQALASKFGVSLLLAGRSMERVGPVAQRLRAEYGASVATLTLDTSSLASVRSAAALCRSMIKAGDIEPFEAILCNAGGQFRGPISYSVDGYEDTFATNYLGHFLLVELLLDDVVDDGRIVFTASGTHDPDTVDGKMVGRAAEPNATALASDGKGASKPLSAGVRYSTSKLCTMLTAYELDRRLKQSGSSLSSIAFDPGSIPETGLLRTMPKPVQWLARTATMKGVMKRMGVTQGSVAFSGASLAKIAVDPAFAGASGKYFQSNNGQLVERRSSKASYDESAAARLWVDSEGLIGLAPEERSSLSTRSAPS